MKERITISFHPSLVEKAEALMERKHYESFSAFLEELVRDEYERCSEAEKQEIQKLIAASKRAAEAKKAINALRRPEGEHAIVMEDEKMEYQTSKIIKSAETKQKPEP